MKIQIKENRKSFTVTVTGYTVKVGNNEIQNGCPTVLRIDKAWLELKKVSVMEAAKLDVETRIVNFYNWK